MIRIGSLLTLIVPATLLFQSCKKNDDDCPFLAPEMVFVGFSESDRDTMIIRRYEKNSMFTAPLDTVLVSKANLTYTVKGADSIQIRPNTYDNLNFEFYKNDWEIVFPSINRVIRVTEATPKFTQEREASARCQSYLSSVNYDGLPYTFTTWFDVPYRVYAVK